MNVVFHITKLEDWERGKAEGGYKADTLESQGFIHCSTACQLIDVANNFYKGQTGLVLLCIDTNMVKANIKYEIADEGESYPHIYGTLDLDAVVKVLSFEPDEDGKFTMPDEIADLS